MDRIAKLEKKSRWTDGAYRVESAHWIVETEISKRFGVEAALFLDGYVYSQSRK